MKRFLFLTFVLTVSQTGYAESLGMLPVPAFKLAIPYPQTWQHRINLGMGGAFMTADFSQNMEDEKSPSIHFMAAKSTQMMQMGMGGMGGAMKGMKGTSSIPGVGGRWSGTQAPPAGSQSPPSSETGGSGGQTGEATSQNVPASNKSIVWLGHRVDKIDSTQTLEDGQIIKIRGVSALIGDKSIMLSCSAPQELFTTEFANLCDRVVKGMKWIKK